jgi:glycosyltransferase involved in cell wall biosynthesis
VPDCKKIVLLCSRLDTPGGIERAVVNTAALLADQGHSVVIIVADTSGLNTSYYPIPPSVQATWIHTDFGIGGKGNILSRKIRLMQDFRKLGKAIRHYTPDIVISSEYHLTTAMVLSGGSGKARQLSWEHHSFGHIKTNRFWSILKNYSYKKLNGIICLNEKEADAYRSYGPVHIIPNFILPPRVKSEPSVNRQIITVGWLTEVKGADRIPAIAKAVLEKNPGWTWKVVGDGPLKPALQNFIEKEQSGKQLQLVSSADADLAQLYAQSSLMVLLSRTEAFPMVLLEAMSYGLPCISFDCPTGPGMIIQDRVDGLLVEDGQIRKMNAAIDSLVNNNELRLTYGEAARLNIQRFSAEAVIKKWECILTDQPG